MAQIIIRNIEETVKSKLQLRAKRNGWSLEAEVREILCNAVTEKHAPDRGLGSEIAAWSGSAVVLLRISLNCEVMKSGQRLLSDGHP